MGDGLHGPPPTQRHLEVRSAGAAAAESVPCRAEPLTPEPVGRRCGLLIRHQSDRPEGRRGVVQGGAGEELPTVIFNLFTQVSFPTTFS